MTLAIGDLQGCRRPLEQLLARADTEPAEALWFAGDLVNRGPDSLGCLLHVRALGARARAVLGNHDLHLLAIACGVRRPKAGDTVDTILRHPERRALLDWLRNRPLAVLSGDFLMVHAGLDPGWDTARTMALAAEVEAVLRGPHWGDFLSVMYGDTPSRWDESLSGDARLRVIVNILTRARFMSPERHLDLQAKGSAASPPPGRVAWFDMPNRRTANRTVVFGHWSTLGLLRRPGLVGLDSGCVWGNALSAVRLEDGEVFQQACPRAADPAGD
ncbi:MAG: symmetrical bis(5'-nucleosyl)-tetraphosphatase [Lautropia sp.]